MPTIITISNIEVRIYFNDTKQHNLPHFHADGPDRSSVFAIDSLDEIGGDLRNKEVKKVQAWAKENIDLLIDIWNDCNPDRPYLGADRGEKEGLNDD